MTTPPHADPARNDAPEAGQPPAPRLAGMRAVPMATILTVFGIGLVLVAVRAWASVLLMGFAALLIGIALREGARVLYRVTGIGLKFGVLLTALAVTALTVQLFAEIGPALSRQFGELVSALPQAWKEVSDWLGNSSIGQFIERRLDAGNGPGQPGTAGSLPSIFGYLTGTITTVFGGVMNVVLLLTMAIFLALDAPTYRGGFLQLVPPGYRPRADQIMTEIGRALSRWMAGQIVDMVIVALLTGLGLWLLGMPLSLVLGLIAGLTNIIPFIGPFLSGVPAVMFALTQGVDMAAYVTILFVVIQQVEGNILMPMIQKYASQLPPVLTMLAIVAVGGAFGIFGVILATPLLLVAIILVQRVYVEDILGDRPPERGSGQLQS